MAVHAGGNRLLTNAEGLGWDWRRRRPGGRVGTSPPGAGQGVMSWRQR
jgi:hypothetical protein